MVGEGDWWCRFAETNKINAFDTAMLMYRWLGQVWLLEAH